jgi:hypothetical protein
VATAPRSTIGQRLAEGYGTRASSAGRIFRVLLAASAAFTKDVGLIATFGGIGVVVNVIVVYIAIQVRGERRQNEEYREHLLDRR